MILPNYGQVLDINHTADRIKLSSETFVQGFAKTSVWLDDRCEAFFILSLIEAKLSFSWLNKDLFLVTTLRNPAQSKFFTAQFALQIPHNFNLFPAPCLKLLLFSAFMSLIRWSCSFRLSEMERSTERSKSVVSIARQTWVLYPCLLPLQNVLLYSPSLHYITLRVVKSTFSSFTTDDGYKFSIDLNSGWIFISGP